MQRRIVAKSHPQKSSHVQLGANHDRNDTTDALTPLLPLNHHKAKARQTVGLSHLNPTDN
jgi:hypothetical protein